MTRRAARSGHRGPPRHFLIAAILPLALATPAFAAWSGSLPENPRSLRWRLDQASPSSDAPLKYLAVDVDGDGVSEEFKVAASRPAGYWYLMLAEPEASAKYQLWSSMTFSPAGIGGASDLLGDGRDELVLWRQDHHDSLRVDILRFDDEGGMSEPDTLASVPLADLELSRLPNGDWSGSAQLLGALDLDGDGTSERLVLGVTTGLRMAPRCVSCVDWTSGRELWRIDTGATPTGGSVVADIDGDGEDEIVIGLESPDNGARAGGWDDSHAYAVALEPDGSLAWSTELAGESAQVSMAASDLDGDGSVEIAVGVSGHTGSDAGRYGLSIHRGADGSVVAWIPDLGAVNDVAVIETTEGPRVFSAGADGTLSRGALSGGAFAIDGRLECGSAVQAVAQMSFAPATPKRLVVAVTSEGVIAATEVSLRPVAVLPTGDYGDHYLDPLFQAGFRDGGAVAQGIFVRTGRSVHYLTLARSPLARGIRSLIIAALGLIAVTSVPYTRRRSLAYARRALVSGSDRGRDVDEILRLLQTADHGMLKATRTFRRLHGQLRGISTSDGPTPEGLEECFRSAAGDVREVGLPALLEIAGLARSLGVAPEGTTRLATGLERVRRLVAGVGETPPARAIAHGLALELENELAPIDAGLEAIKKAAERERSCQLARGLGSILAVWRDEAARRKISLVAPDSATIPAVRVIVTARELSFVLDNLLDNAFRAVEGRPDPRVVVAVRVDGSNAVITVADNGKGIEPHLHEAIFQPGASDRKGGGLGLSESRAILKARGGSIRLVHSAPGEGSLFEVTLRVCR